MSDHLVRVENLRRLQKERRWTDSELARRCGRQPQQLRAWWNFPEKGGRQIGEKLARALEEVLGLARYSLDERPTTKPKLSAGEGSKDYQATPLATMPAAAHRTGTDVPVLAWDTLKDMLMEPNERIAAETPTLDTFAEHTGLAKFVAMPDDSMDPVYSEGDHILFDPAEAPRAGDTVLVALGSGEYLVRLFKPKTAHQWEAAPINANYQSLTSADDMAAEVVAVMVEHRRYRKRRG